jgi:DNA repair exonuclease SbcCD ATPase subunit
VSESPAQEVSLDQVKRRLNRVEGKRDELATLRLEKVAQRSDVMSFLDIADEVTAALETLSNDIFQQQLKAIESSMTKALQEVLDQPIVFKTECTFKRDAASVEFSIVRDGNEEDIMKGQGGSVANVLSVGLRMLAITTLNEKRHRRFLVLDEQDCWLHPDLVPKLTKIVSEAGTRLGFQVLMISHHDVNQFVRHADRVYRLSPDRGEGVGIELVADHERQIQP